MLSSRPYSYSETIKLAYSTNTFSFNELDCVRWFASSTLRLEIITSLRLYWQLDRVCYQGYDVKPHYVTDWESFCETLLRMRGLKELRIKLDGTPTRMQSYPYFPLTSLRRLTGLDVFQIYVPVNFNQGLTEHSGPFQLIDVREWPQQ